MGRISLNDRWDFTERFSERLFDPAWEGDTVPVRLPHTCKETPFDYFDEHEYQMVCGYRRRLELPEAWRGKRLLLTFGAAGHYAEVFLNGEKLCEHRCGYTAFTVELTEHAVFGGENLLVVKLDTRETLDQPPFGYVIDYMTYGGLYREVWLEVKEPRYIADVFLKPQVDLTRKTGVLRSQITLAGPAEETEAYSIRQTISPLWAPERALTRGAPVAGEKLNAVLECGGVELWDVENPALYLVKTELLRDGAAVDTHEARVGFRHIEFQADGFYLNGRKTKLVGLNRHQSYPYVGYAMPESMQRLDADILKRELGLNAVRTSHYPQSQHFIDRCDELGLLVFTEIPGWQHLGGEGWKAQAVENVKEMVTQYRNHPSIILWGVRINESQDDDALYARTNRVAHALDPTRPTGGVRYLKKSSLLEDVYTYNDFVHSGDNRGCEPKRAVTSDRKKPYLISEYNGHMFPTKPYDSEAHIQEHALRHARVLDAAAGEADVAGSFGWCMFDYNTHRDFGSGDRICYHGVMDMYRNPKLAAAIYRAGQTETPVLEISSQMDIGEHPGGSMGKVYIITNADSVRMYKNNRFLKEYFPADSPYSHLPHGPILIDDYVGDRLAEEEGFSKGQARLVRDILNACAIRGVNDMDAKTKAKAARAMAMYRMTFADAYELYGKYIGSWGGDAAVFRFEAIRDGAVVKTVIKTPATAVHLRVEADHTELTERETYDVAALRVTMADQNGNLARFFQGAVRLETQGPIALIGPELLELRGGGGGTYVKTTGAPGPAALTLRHPQGGTVRVEFHVTKEKEEETV